MSTRLFTIADRDCPLNPFTGEREPGWYARTAAWTDEDEARWQERRAA